MATSDSLIEVTAGKIRVHFHSDASQLSVAVRSPVTARLFYDTGGWNTVGTRGTSSSTVHSQASSNTPTTMHGLS